MRLAVLPVFVLSSRRQDRRTADRLSPLSGFPRDFRKTDPSDPRNGSRQEFIQKVAV